MESDSADFWELRLGWLETFLAVAHHLDYGKAGEELGIPADRADKRVSRLESWLGRRLVWHERSGLELNLPYAEEFMLAAIDVLNAFDACCVYPAGQVPVRQRSLLRLSDLHGFVTIARWRNFAEAEYRSSKHAANIRRNVHNLERVLGRRLISGRSMGEVRLEPPDFVETANVIIARLRDIRGLPPMENEIAETTALVSLEDHLLQLYKFGTLHLPLWRSKLAVWESRARLSLKAKQDMEQTKRNISLWQELLPKLEALIVISPRLSGKDVEIDKLSNTS